jgi:hypothetical protein
MVPVSSLQTVSQTRRLGDAARHEASKFRAHEGKCTLACTDEQEPKLSKRSTLLDDHCLDLFHHEALQPHAIRETKEEKINRFFHLSILEGLDERPKSCTELQRNLSAGMDCDWTEDASVWTREFGRTGSAGSRLDTPRKP